jgi:Planctomycete cytochrome C
MPRFGTGKAIAAGSFGELVPPKSAHAATAKEPATNFQEDMRPVLRGRCVSCHSPSGDGYKASGLDLTSYKGVLAGTKFGPMVNPGEPDSSNLMRLLNWRAAPQLRMPHSKKQLSVCDRNAIRIGSARVPMTTEAAATTT